MKIFFLVCISLLMGSASTAVYAKSEELKKSQSKLEEEKKVEKKSSKGFVASGGKFSRVPSSEDQCPSYEACVLELKCSSKNDVPDQANPQEKTEKEACLHFCHNTKDCS